MNAVIGISIVLLNVLLGLFYREKVLLLYIVLAIVLPVTNIFGVKISYEILFFFPILILYILTKRKTKIDLNGRYLVIYLFLFIISTLLTNLIQEPTNESMAIFGIARMVILFIIFTNYSNYGELFKKSIKIALYINAIAMLLQLILPNAVEIFHTLYAKESSTALDWFYTVGRFTRLTGTFSNTSPAAFFFLVVTAVYLVEYSKNNSSSNIIVLIIAMVCGVATVSKTFYVGFPILIMANLVLKVYLKNKEKLYQNGLDLKKHLFIIIGITGIIVFLKLTEGKLYTSYYISNLSFTNIFSSRYSSKSGNLIEAIDVIKNNLLIGVGATRVAGEFVGDSLYVTAMHSTGIFGFSVLLFMFIGMIKINFRKYNRQNLLLILCIIMGGVAVPTLFNFFGILTLAFIDTNIKNYNNTSDKIINEVNTTNYIKN